MLGIAAQLFAERGFSSVTVDDLGAAAGVSGPALYHHFDGKEALLGEMLVGISRSLLDRANALLSSGKEDLLGALIEMHVDFAVDDRPLITVHFRELVNARDADRKRVRELQNTYVDIWVDALVAASRDLDPRTARAAVHAALGLMNSTPYSGRLRRDEMTAVLVTMTRAALHSML
ncbi:MAG: TetR/AcrR family transcriptional regulator [Acidimicrobiales bacterium]|nr:TetR/AcrR family transcriptional regulator [Acidimicrobiales bacterium]